MNILLQKGNLTRDPETRYTPKGTAITQFGIAVNRRWKGEDGQAKEEVTFTDWQAWGKTGETIAKFFKKGDPIICEGRLAQEEWEDKQTGEKRRKSLGKLETFHFCGSKAAEGGQRTARPAPRQAGEPVPPAGSMQDGLEDDEISF
jgi:single-strand DNA-binding protein